MGTERAEQCGATASAMFGLDPRVPLSLGFAHCWIGH